LGKSLYGGTFTARLQFMKMILRPLLIVAIFAAAGIPLNSSAVLVVQSTNNNYGLVLWWPLDESSGTTTAEASGNGYTGALYNSATWTTGIITNGVSLNSSSSDYVGASGPANMGGATSATLCGWVKTTAGFTFGFNDNNQSRLSIEGGGGQIYWQVENGASSYPSSPYSFDGNWHWFALCYNGSASGLSRITAYIDGTAQTLTTGGADPAGVLSAGLGSFTIGRTLANSRYYTMNCDDVRLYNRTLSSAEITNLFQWPAGGRTVWSAGRYYIDYSSGSDTNNGLSTNAPWQHHPYMQGWTGVYNHQPGDHFIFRGGVVWPRCYLQPQAGGSPGNSDYYGVDSNWFSGSSFSRPVFDGGHAVTTVFYIGQGVANINFDSLEVRAITCNADGQGLFAFNQTHDITGNNLWLHDWLNYSSAPGSDTGHGAWVWNNGNSGYSITNMILANSEVDNIENGASGNWNGNCIIFGGVITNCLIHDNNSTITFAQDVNHCTIWDVDYPYTCFDPGEHCNGFYMDNGTGNSTPPAGVSLYCRNTIFHDVGNAANMAYPNVEKFDCYVYNCLFYGAMSSQEVIAIDDYDYGYTGVMKSCYIYNNTIVLSSYPWSTGIVPSSRAGLLINNLWITNNLIIGASAGVPAYSGASPNIVNAQCGNNLALTPAQAAAAGCTLATLYAPTSPAGLAIGQGSSAPSILFNNDIMNSPRPATGWSVGAYQYPSAPAIPSPWNADLHVVAGP
jgi:hypothetical protein